MKPNYSNNHSNRGLPINNSRKPFKKQQSYQPIINYQIKGFISDSDTQKSLSPAGLHPASFSNLASGSEEERAERREFIHAKIMFEGTLIQNYEEKDTGKTQRKFQDEMEKSGPNLKHIPLPWFV